MNAPSELICDTISKHDIKLSFVNSSLSKHPVSDLLLSQFMKQFKEDKYEQLPEIDNLFTFDVETTVKMIHRNGKHLWFIHFDERVIGFVTLLWNAWPVKKSVLICDFFIDKRYRNRGYGKKAMNAIIAKIYEHYPETERISLSVLSANERAKNLYRDIGFNTNLETMILEKNKTI